MRTALMAIFDSYAHSLPVGLGAAVERCLRTRASASRSMWIPCAARARAYRGSRRCSRSTGSDATFYFSVGPDHTGRAMRRVFRKGFAQKVARTSVLKHYGLKTLMYGVLLPGPDIGRKAGAEMRRRTRRGIRGGSAYLRSCALAGLRGRRRCGVDSRRSSSAALRAFERVFGFLPQSHAAAGWQINSHGLELEREYGLRYASDTRGGAAFFPLLAGGASTCPQIADHACRPSMRLLGRDGTDESNIADAVFRLSTQARCAGEPLQVFTLHAELEGMLLRRCLRVACW